MLLTGGRAHAVLFCIVSAPPLEGAIDLGQAAQIGLAQPGHRLHPAERLLDPFADTLARGIAGMACGASVDRRSPATRVLRDMGAPFDGAQFLDEVSGIVASCRHPA
jgi:hypothetical protein